MTRPLVATLIGLVYLAAGRHADETTIDAWQIALEDLADGDDIIPTTRRLARANPDRFVTAAMVFDAVTAERRRAAESAEYHRPDFTRPELEQPPSDPEVVAYWRARLHEQRSTLHGPLAQSLVAIATGQPRRPGRRVDENYVYKTTPVTPPAAKPKRRSRARKSRTKPPATS